MAWTVKEIKALPTRDAAYRIFEGGSDPGFCIQVAPSGAKTFYLQYRRDGKKRFYRLGSFPATSLAKARELCRDARSVIDQGNDPRLLDEERQRQRRTAGTMRDLSEVYLDTLQGRYRRNVEAAFKAYVDLDRPARDVTPEDIQRWLSVLVQADHAVAANRLRSYLHRAFALGLRYDHDPRAMGREMRFRLTWNPVEAVPRNAEAETTGERTLSWEEVRDVWDTQKVGIMHRQALRLLIATGQRPTELLGAARSEFSDGLWSIAGTRTKNGRAHIIPVPGIIWEVIEETMELVPDADWLFPSRNSPKAKKPWVQTSLAYAVREVSEWTWTPRDLRRTWKTLTGEAGLSKDLRDRLQNHALHDVSSRHYDKYDYLNEKRAAMETWGEYLRAMLDDSGKVVSLSRGWS